MDELELLKKQWQTREQNLPTVSYNDIYKMLLKKSSSIVKWIFLISIAELLFWTLLAFFVPESSRQLNDKIGLHNSLVFINVLHYCIFAMFIYFFYKNYTSIKNTDTVKDLMENILKTRKTVRYFVIYNVGATILLMIGINLYYYTRKEQLYQLMVETYDEYATIPLESFTSVFFIFQIIFGIILIGIVLLFYRVIYGILLRRLSRNYKELKKIEI